MDLRDQQKEAKEKKNKENGKHEIRLIAESGRKTIL
ncbi:hypothetical protein G159_13720 [Planococcus glaciei CHR43]|nr:hypothetical protein G159_13720 [Planococcus glaciei CHR43]